MIYFYKSSLLPEFVEGGRESSQIMYIPEAFPHHNGHRYTFLGRLLFEIFTLDQYFQALRPRGGIGMESSKTLCYAAEQKGEVENL